jgi:inositol phosphorylceramide mannosyltransferase catalytic subunit
MVGKIPRRLIQTNRSADLPLLAKAAAANLRLLNPDFEYLFFDDSQVERFIAVQFPEYRSVFDSFSVPIQRYDFFRYLAVYHFGGFYFDTDVLLASSLEDLREFSCVFPFEHLSIYKFLREEHGMDWEVGNYAFGATAGHPFLKAIIENCVRGQQHPEWLEAMLRSIPRIFRRDYAVLAGTGPGLVSRTLAEYRGACDEVKVLFPDDVCDPNDWFCFGHYGVHLQAGTWRKREGLLLRQLHKRWSMRRQKELLKESRKRGRKRTLAFQN